MKTMRKIGALVLAIMMIAAVGAAYAATGLTDGEVGGFAPDHVDTPYIDDKTVIIQKQIKAFNPDEKYVFGPNITYTYSISAATGKELDTITDQTADHLSGEAITATAKPGANPGSILINNSAATTDDTVVWTNADILEATAEGQVNTKSFTLNFVNVVFDDGPGIYRYKITETATYSGTGVTEKSDHNRYLDVYVIGSTTDDSTGTNYTDGSTAAQWRIYGYVCIDDDNKDADEKPDVAPVTPSTTTKTNGFVNGEADEYYTYNLTLSKDVVNDAMGINNQFPFSVEFSNTLSGTFQLIAKQDASSKSTIVTGTAKVDKNTATFGPGIKTDTDIVKLSSAQILSSSAYAMKIADGNMTIGETTGFVKIIGIPNSEIATVTETNNVTGVIYTASVKEDDTGAAPTTQVDMTGTSNSGGLKGSEKKVASITTNETATRMAATGNTADAAGKNIAIQFTNNLSIISPTGYVSRYAPYALILIGGIALLVIAMKRRNRKEDD